MADYFLFNRLIISLCILPCLSMAAYADDVNEQISDAPVVVLQTIDTDVKMNAKKFITRKP